MPIFIVRKYIFQFKKNSSKSSVNFSKSNKYYKVIIHLIIYLEVRENGLKILKKKMKFFFLRYHFAKEQTSYQKRHTFIFNIYRNKQSLKPIDS